MSRLPLPRAANKRPAILAAVAVLVVLTVIGTAPPPTEVAQGAEEGGSSPMLSMSEPIATGSEGLTFAQVFDEMRDPELGGGEGQGTVVLAAATPEAPQSQDGTQGEPATTTSTPVPAVLPPVEPVLPTLTVTAVSPEATAAMAGLEGVTYVAAAQLIDVMVPTPGGQQELTLAAIDPTAFRPMTPAITANETGVWQRIIAGDLVFNHDAGNRLTVPLGENLQVGEQAVRIGAYASNGIPPVADALLAAERAASLGLTAGEVRFYVALDQSADVAGVIQAIESAVPGAQVSVIEEPEQQQAFLTGSDAANFFEPFNYIDHGDGLITIDQDWVNRNIATRQLPIFTGQVTCHRQMLIQLEGALREVEAAGLAPLIDTSDYGGCWVARHIDWRPDKPISMHGWGLAVDFNVQTNQLGATPTMDPRIVEIFDRWGFVWGGRWSRPDGMHFEIGAVLQNPPAGQ